MTIVPTVTFGKYAGREVCLMVFPDYDKNSYEFHLVEFCEGNRDVLVMNKTYKSPINPKQVAEDFDVGVTKVRFLLKKLEI